MARNYMAREILDALSRQRGSILANTSGQATRDSLAAQRQGVLGSLAGTRQEILANTGGQSVRDSLAATREGIIRSVRGSNAGPQMMPHTASPEYTQAAFAASGGDPYKAALEARYADQMADAQNIVQRDVTLRPGADAFVWDATTQAKAMQRAQMAEKAAREYNAAMARRGASNPALMKSVMRSDL